MKRLFYCVSVLFLMASCSFFSESDNLRRQNDSLMVAKSQMEKEINGYFVTMNEIESNLNKISEIEGYLSAQNNTEGVEINQRDRINQNIALVSEILQKNNREIANLKKQLKNSNFNLKEFEKKVQQLNKELNEKVVEIQRLEEELAKKDELIVQQEISIRGLQADVEELTQNVANKEQLISEQDEEIHTAWYVFGTRKELKEQKIISESGLFSSKKVLQGDFNKDYFVKVDARELDRVPLYARKAKILTTHPKNSYRLEKVDNTYVIEIFDKKAFWSVSNYLVVEVD
jgi:chromosome segregation ATPase